MRMLWLGSRKVPTHLEWPWIQITSQLTVLQCVWLLLRIAWQPCFTHPERVTHCYCLPWEQLKRSVGKFGDHRLLVAKRVSGWVCGTAWWKWKSSKALLSGSGGMAWGRQTSRLWQASAEGERDCEKTDCAKLSIFLYKPAFQLPNLCVSPSNNW